MLERRDLEDNRACGESIGDCCECNSEIMEWEEYYDLEGTLIHDDCVFRYLRQFKVNA